MNVTVKCACCGEAVWTQYSRIPEGTCGQELSILCLDCAMVRLRAKLPEHRRFPKQELEVHSVL